jgi:hypothetical protein
MLTLLLILYVANATLLIVHEIDSAYWQEWKLFKLPGGPAFFLVLHIPLVIIILLGLLYLSWGTIAGLVISLIMGAGGIFAFSIHTTFIARGRSEFKTATSLAILWAMLIVSLAQVALSAYGLATGIFA